MINNRLIDRNSASPSCRRIATTLYIARCEFDSGQQTTHTPHVAVAIASNLVANTPDDKHLLAILLERFQDLFELKIGSLGVRPKVLFNCAIGREHDHQTLAFLFASVASVAGCRFSNALKIAYKRQSRTAVAKPLEEVSSGVLVV